MRSPQTDNGKVDWADLYGQKFTGKEITQAADFADIIMSMGVNEEMLAEFVKEELKLGIRLFLSMNIPLNYLAKMLLIETDPRIISICKERCGEINRKAEGHSNIIIARV